MGNQQSLCLKQQNQSTSMKYEHSINPIKYGKRIFNTQQQQLPSYNFKFSSSKNNFTSKNLAGSQLQSGKQPESTNKTKIYQFDHNLQFSETGKFGQKQSEHKIQKGEHYKNNNNIGSVQVNNWIIPKKEHFSMPQQQRSSKISKTQQNSKWNQNPSFERKKENKVSSLFKNQQGQQKQFRTSQHFSDLSQNKKGFKKSLVTPSESRLEQDREIVIEYLPIVNQLISRQKPFEHQLSTIAKEKVKKLRVNNRKDIFKGQTNEKSIPNGYGILVKENGSVLIGHFRDGSAEGEACYIFFNGSFYKGNMIKNKANDEKGQFCCKKFTYVGGFKDNCFHGECQELGENYHFKGIYWNNVRKQGVLSWQVKPHKSTINQSSSNTNLNQPQKSSVQIDHKQSQVIINEENQLPIIKSFQKLPIYKYVYEGKFDVQQLFTGEGKLKDPNGFYLGNFQRGQKQGNGQYFYSSKLKYIGQYQHDKKEGYGILKNCDDTIAYEGFWKDGLPNGKGSSYDLYGRKTQGQFYHGLNSKIIPHQQLLEHQSLSKIRN